MGTAIAVRTDFSSQKLRRLATRVRNAAQARRLLAIAAVLDGAARKEAAKIGSMDRQTLRDWVIRFNDQGPDGLINKSSPGAPGKLSKEHKAFLARLVEEGPIPASHGVVRWRDCDLIMRLHEEFGISVSDDTVYRALRELGFSHVSARPKAYKQDPEAMEAFKKRMAPRSQVVSTRSSDQSASTYPVSEIFPGQDGDLRVLILINFPTAMRHFFDQDSRTPVRLSGHLAFYHPQTSKADQRMTMRGRPTLITPPPRR